MAGRDLRQATSTDTGKAVAGLELLVFRKESGMSKEPFSPLRVHFTISVTGVVTGASDVLELAAVTVMV
jgi:hypothetical protein